MKSLLWRTPIVLKQMIRLLALILAGCVVCAGLILIEFGSISNHRPSSGTCLPPTEIEPAAPEIRKLADALFSPKQRRPETPSAANDADSQLRDVRLTGVVIGPDLRIAIFAVTGASPLMLSESDTLKDWRLDSISLERVVLSGPAGSIVLEPKPDANLVRPPPPAAVQAGQLEPDVPHGVALAGAPQQPMAVTPIAIGNLSTATPVQTQGYPDYFPEYYAGYDQYYPSYDYYPSPFWFRTSSTLFRRGSVLGLAFFAMLVVSSVVVSSMAVPSTVAVSVDAADAILGAPIIIPMIAAVLPQRGIGLKSNDFDKV